MDIGLLTPLELRPLPQPVPLQFRMDLYHSYHQSRRHDTDQCTTLQHVIQDIIDRGSVSVDQLGAVANPLIAHSTHMVPSIFNPHFASHVEDVDTQMMSYEGAGS